MTWLFILIPLLTITAALMVPLVFVLTKRHPDAWSASSGPWAHRWDRLWSNPSGDGAQDRFVAEVRADIDWLEAHPERIELLADGSPPSPRRPR